MSEVIAPVEASPPVPPRVSLLSSAQSPPPGEDARWMAGFSWEPFACGTEQAGVFDICDPSDISVDFRTESNKTFIPFGVYASDRCSRSGANDRAWQNRAQAKLAACESRQIEREFWRGDLARAAGWGNAYLAHTNADLLSASSLNAMEALACLEAALGDCDCGGRGMIHVTREVASIWSYSGALRREGGLVLTINDTIVVPGAGYDGSGAGVNPGDAPVAATDGAIWAYATGMVTVRRSPVEFVPESLKEALDRSTNTVEVRAQRVAAATFDCCLFAVPVDAPLCDIGGAGS